MTTVANKTELMSALFSAVSGDRIELVGGNYGFLTISGLTFPSDVTIASADLDAPAVINDLKVLDCIHLVFDGILFNYVYAGESWLFRPFEVDRSAFITIRNSVFDGALNGVFGTGFGVYVSNSDNFVLENNEFFHWNKAVHFGAGSNTVVLANNVHSISQDAFNVIAVDGLLFEGNWIHDFLPDALGHADMFQVWNQDVDNPARNYTIRGNFFDSSGKRSVHTIFMRNGKSEKDPTNLNLFFRDILIEDNVIYNAHVHGITVGSTLGLTVRNNTMLADRFVTAGMESVPQLRLSSNSQNVIIEGNILHRKVKEDGLPVEWNVGEWFLVQDSDPNSANYYGDLFVNALIRNPSLADLRAVSGGVVEMGGWGAAMTRSDIPMTAGPLGIATDPVTDPEPDPDPIPDTDPDTNPVTDPGEDTTMSIFQFGPKTFTGDLAEAEIFPHDPVYELAEGTLEMTFTPSALGTRIGVFSKDSDGFDTGGHIAVFLEGSDILVRLQSTSASHEIRLPNVVQADTEYHLAVTFGPLGMEAWLDGMLVSQNAYTGGMQGNAEPIVIGANQWKSDNLVANKLQGAFSGVIDRVGLYDRVLSSAEIELLAGLTPLEPPTDTQLTLDALQVQISENLASLSAMQAQVNAFISVSNSASAVLTARVTAVELTQAVNATTVEAMQAQQETNVMAIAAMLAQIDMNLGRLVTLEDAHDALVVDVDARLGVAVTAISTLQTQVNALVADVNTRLAVVETALARKVTVVAG